MHQIVSEFHLQSEFGKTNQTETPYIFEFLAE